MTELQKDLQITKEAVKNHDIIGALYYAHSLTTFGRGFRFLSLGYRIAKGLQRDLYYRPNLVTVHDADFDYLEQLAKSKS